MNQYFMAIVVHKNALKIFYNYVFILFIKWCYFVKFVIISILFKIVTLPVLFLTTDPNGKKLFLRSFQLFGLFFTAVITNLFLRS